MAKSKKSARKVRQGSEFHPRQLMSKVRPPAVPSVAYSWDLSAIMSARDEQIAGRFTQPARLAVSMRTDDALATAYKNRLAPQRALSVVMEPGRGNGARSIAAESESLFGKDGVAVSSNTLADINGDLANHGIAIGYNDWTVRLPMCDRIDPVHRCWPMEYVYWDESRQSLMTQCVKSTDDGFPGGYTITPITHGDGRWVVYSTHSLMPWRQDAAILPGALIWAAHAFAVRDWSRGSASHGNAKVVGELPSGVALQKLNDDGDAVMSSEAEAFLALLEDIASLDTPVGIRPAGSAIDYLMNTSRAWEVWERLMVSREKAAARVYLGTDGTLGAAGGAPGVDISELFNIATTIMQSDLSAIERGLRTGLIEPWCALNFGDSAAAPRRRYLVPDADQERVRDERIKQEKAFTETINQRAKAGMVITQDYVNDLADLLGVPRGELAETKAAGITLAPTDAVKVINVDEARASLGLPPDPSIGKKRVAELEAATEAKADIAVEEASAEAKADAEQSKPKLRSA